MAASVQVLQDFESAIVDLIDAVREGGDVGAALEHVKASEASLTRRLDDATTRQQLGQQIGELQARLDVLTDQAKGGLRDMATKHDALWQPIMPDREVRDDRAGVDYSTLMQYANRISRQTTAPPEFDASTGRKTATHMPWPTEDLMRRGRLAAQAQDAPQQKVEEDDED